MEAFLSMDNILTGDEAANLFLDDDNQTTDTPPKSEQKEEDTKDNKDNDTTTTAYKIFYSNLKNRF